MTHDTKLTDFVTKQRRGVLATIRRDGRPQLSTVSHLYNPDADTLTISVTETRAKTKNMRRDPRVTYQVISDDPWSYVVVEGTAELSEPAKDPHDATVEALVDYYRRAQGEHPDWDEYRQAMVDDQRVVLTLHVDRMHGLLR